MSRLSGKRAIVTGGAQGQGAAIVRAFVAEGARVVIADVAEYQGTALAAELGEAARFVRVDVSDEASWAGLMEQAVAHLGGLDVLVNNAGILRFNEIVNTTVAEYQQVFAVNQLGCFLGMRAAIPELKKAHGGSIINASSIEGLGGMPFLVAYSATKFAIRGMTKVAAMELGPDKIRVNSVHPGMIDTKMVRQHIGDGPAGLEFGAKKVALKRVGVPEDVGGLYVFLASDESAYVTGAEITVDGGATATHAFGG